MLQEMHPSLSAEATSAALDKENVSRNRNPGLIPGIVSYSYFDSKLFVN